MRSGRYAMDASSGGVGSDARGRDLRFLVALLGCVGRPVFVTGLHDREVLFSSIAATPGSEESGVGSRAEILLKSAGVFATEIPKLRQRASGVELYGERRVAGGMVSPFVMDVFTVFCGAGCGVEGEGFRIGVMRSPEESGFVREMERSLQALLVRYDLELVSVVGDGGGNVYDSPSVLREFGPGLFSRVHPEDTERLDTWLGSAVSEGEVCEYRTRDVAGEWRTVRSSVEIYGEKVLVGGKVVRSRVVRGGMGGELEPDFRALVTNLTEVVKICDPDGTIRYVSPSMKQTFGYEPEDMVGRNVLEYVHPEDLPYVVAKTQEAMESPEVARNVAAYRFLHADGDWRDVESSGVYLLEDPGVRGVIVNSRDVTTERDAERRLRESEERYRKLVEQVPGMIYMRDYHDRATLYDSPQLDAMLGYPPDTCARDPHYWMKIVHPEDVQLYRDATVAGDHFSAEYRVLAADGREVWLKDDAVIVRDGDGEPLCWQGMRLDITDRKATEASLRESEERSRRNAWELSLLHGVRTAVQREMETEEIISIGIEFIASSYGYTQVSAYTLRDGELKLRHQVGYDEVISSMPVERGIMGKTVREGRGILVEDVHASEEFVGAIEGIVSEVCVPLPGDAGETLGVLNLESVDGVVLDGEDLRIAVALGQILGLAVSRARLYKKMRDTERKYRMLVEQIPAVTYVQSLSHDHTITFVSPQIAQMLGYEPWEFYADDALWYDVVHPDDRGKVLAEDNRTDRTREPFSMEYRMVGRCGEVVWITDEATLFFDESGEPRFWHGMLYNVTERKRFDEALRESEERFRSLVQNASDLIIILDRDQRSTYMSPSIEKIQGFSTEEALGRSAFENIHPDDADRIRSEFGRLLEEPTYESVVDFRLRHRNGSWLHVEAVGRNLLDDPAVGGIVVNARDITARKLTEDALQESEARLSTVTSGAPIIFFAIDLDGVITLSKGKGLALLGLEEGAAVGENVFETFAHLTPMVEGVRRALRGEEAAVMLELRDLSFDAKYSPVRDERGVVTGVVGVATDMTGRRKLEKELEYRAFHDPLTGLANRALCMNRITHALQRADRDSCPVTILFMDLDDFKMVNDSLGHDTGDMLLVEAAERLRGCLRPGDTLARLGGDEFVIVLEATGLDEATKVARRIEELLQRPFRLGDSGQERYVTFSVGITVSQGSQSTAEDMLREADLAMYRAKAEGKASYAVFDSGMSARMMQRIDLESNLRRALDNFEFEVFYQPIVSISTGEISCLEALVRWRRPGWGLVSPGEFVALAEETSMILPIGQRVIEDACRNLSRWRESSGRSDLSVSVNLSARQFRHPGLRADIERVLEETNIPPESLRLEITENVVMSAGPETVTLTELKQLGVGLMIDDFGTGHSSLSYLKRLPVGYLKIDRSFCAGLLDGNAVDSEIVAAVIRLGHATGLEVVAEGVESPKQLACLRELGCDFAQGFLFSRPIPAAEIPDILPPDPGRIVRIGSG